MIYKPSRAQVRWLVVLTAALVYFIISPEDLAAVLGPLGPLSKAAAEVLAVSQAVSPWLYALAAVALICWTAREFGAIEQHRSGSVADGQRTPSRHP